MGETVYMMRMLLAAAFVDGEFQEPSGGMCMDEQKVTSEMSEEEMREQIANLTRRIFELERAVDRHGIERVNIYEAPQVQKEVYSSSQSAEVYTANSKNSVYRSDNSAEVYNAQNSTDVYRKDTSGQVYRADVSSSVYARINSNNTYTAQSEVGRSSAGEVRESADKSTKNADNDMVRDLFTEPYVFTSNRDTAEKNSEKTAREDNSRLEKTIGKNIMLVAASVLVFIGAVLFAIVIIPEMNDTIKQIMMYVAGMIMAGVGAYKYKKDTENKWFLGLWACGMGVLFIAVLVSHLYFESFGEVTLYILLVIWTVIVAFITRRTGLLFAIINQLGIGVAVTLASIKLISDGDNKQLLMLLIYFLVTELLTYLFSLKKEYGKNLVSILGFVYNVFFINITMMVNLDGLDDSYEVAIFVLALAADLLPVAMSLFYHSVGEKDALASSLVDGLMFGMSYISIWSVCGMEKAWLSLLIYSLVIFGITDICILKRSGEDKVLKRSGEDKVLKRSGEDKVLKERVEDVVWKVLPSLGIIFSTASSEMSEVGILMAGIAVVFYIYGVKVKSKYNEIFGKVCFCVAMFLPMNSVIRLIIAIIVFILSDVLQKEEDVEKIIWKVFPALAVPVAAIFMEIQSEGGTGAGYMLLGISIAAYLYSQLIPSVFNKYFAEVCFTLSLFFDIKLIVLFIGALVILTITDFFDRREHLSKILWKIIPSLALLGTVLEMDWFLISLVVFVFAVAYIACGFAFDSIFNRCVGMLWYVALVYVNPEAWLLIIFAAAITALVLWAEKHFESQYNVFDKVAVYIITIIAAGMAADSMINGIVFLDWSWCDLFMVVAVSAVNILLIALPQMRKNPVTGNNEHEPIIVFFIFNSIFILWSMMNMNNSAGAGYVSFAVAVVLCLITSVGLIRRKLLTGTVHAFVKFLILFIYALFAYDAPDYIMSVSLMSYALIVLIVGFAFERRYKESLSKLRIPALVLTLLCILKLLLLDFSYDSNLLRAASYLFAGALCFAISFIYTKIDKKLANAED